MKKWFLERFLPMWAKQTVLKDNRRMARRLRELEQENKLLQSYIDGIHRGLTSRYLRRNYEKL